MVPASGCDRRGNALGPINHHQPSEAGAPDRTGGHQR